MAKKPEKKVSRKPATERNVRRMVKGIVKSDKMDKTISVTIERRVRHPKFGKSLRKFTNCKVHDEKNEAREGDIVEIMETRPISATKRWRLMRVLRKSAVQETVVGTER